MQSVSPVWTEEEVEIEKVIALDQEDYIPIIILPVKYAEGTTGMSVRFRLSDEERKSITEDSDIVITELTSGRLFTPIHIQVCKQGEKPY